jgi:hypothetical protein
MKKVEVTKIVVQMGEREQTLTIEQARTLQRALNALFGEPAVKIIKEYKPYWPYREPYWYSGTGLTYRTLGNDSLSYDASGLMKLSNSTGQVDIKL